MLKSLIEQLNSGKELSHLQVSEAVEDLIDTQLPVETKAAFLTALAVKGESINEMAAFARELQLRAIHPFLDEDLRQRPIIDVCGTGGDQLKTFNISTTVALVLASAGVTVAKHGNRAVTSQSGSADLLEALGIPIDLSPEQAVKSLQEHQFAFFFAPKYHPAFKHIAPARRWCAERGQRTIFNYLGPLLNPVRPSAQLVGVPRADLCEPIARVLQTLGTRRAMVVSGRVKTPSDRATPELFLDELSTLGDNTLAEFYQGRGFAVSVMSPGDFPLQAATLADLRGGEAEQNAATVWRLAQGEERGPKRDAILLNAAAGLMVAGRTRTMIEGWELAEQLIDQGKVETKLQELAIIRR